MRFLFLFLFLLFSLHLQAQMKAYSIDQLAQKSLDSANRVLLIGEHSHDDIAMKAVFFQIVVKMALKNPELKICVGLEHGEKFNKIVQEYFKTDKTRDDYEKIVQAYNLKMSQLIGPKETLFADRPRLPFKMLTALSQFDLRIFGIDINLFHKDAAELLKLARLTYNGNKGNSWSMENLSKEQKLKFSDEFMRKRNQIMAQNIETHLNSGLCSKFVVLVGSAHILPWKNDEGFNFLKGFQQSGLVESDFSSPVLSVQELLEAKAIETYSATILATKHEDFEKAQMAVAYENIKEEPLNYIYFPASWSRSISEKD